MRIPDFLKSQKKLTGNYLSLSIGLGLCSGFLLILQAWLLANIINDVIFNNAALDEVYSWLFAMLGVFFVRAWLSWASEITAFKAAARVKADLRARLHKHILSLGPIATDGERSGELINTLVDGVEALEGYYARYLPTMSLVVLIPLSILVFVFPIDWISGLVLLLTAPLIPFFMILIGKGTEKLNKKQWRKMARMSAHFLDMIQGLSTLKIFNAGQREAETIKRISDEYRQSTMSVLRVAFLSSLVLEFLASISIALVAVLIGFRLLYGEIDFFFGFFALLLAPEFYLPLRNMGTHYHARLEAIGVAEKMLDILQMPLPENKRDQTSDQHTQRTKTPEALLGNHKPIRIKFENVGFAYDDRGSALKNISFDIPAGQRIALVGKSGSGKTTILRMLAGFIQPSSGVIKVNQQSLDQINIEDWRKNLAWVTQNPYLFHGTLYENIALGKNQPSKPEVRSAARLAHIDQFIEGLPDGYDTLIGERGEGLSGGQAQRIALARAFLKDAPLILLDEATAHLDVKSEQLIQQSLDSLAKNRTLFMIAHRLNTVQHADQILLIDNGQIMGSGTHENLLEENEIYRQISLSFNEISQ